MTLKQTSKNSKIENEKRKKKREEEEDAFCKEMARLEKEIPKKRNSQKKNNKKNDNYDFIQQQQQLSNKIGNLNIISNTQNDNNNNNKNNNKNEILFWKVYRNVFLNFKIFSLLKSSFKLGVFSYDQVISMGWMIKYGYIDLLKFKINRNEHLYGDSNIDYNLLYPFFKIFKNDENLDDGGKDKIIISNYIKDNLVVEEEHHNGGKQLILSSKLKTILETISIELDSVILMNILVEQYYHLTRFSQFIESIKLGSNKVANYLYQTFDYDIDKSDMKNQLKLKKPKNQNCKLLLFFDFFIFKENLETILNCCQSLLLYNSSQQQYLNLILKLKDNNNVTIINQIENESSSSLNVKLTMFEFNEIKSTFTNDELKQIVGNFSSKDKRVKKLYSWLMYFIGLKEVKGEFKLFKNYLFYKAKYSKLFLNFKEDDLQFSFNRFQFGDFDSNEHINSHLRINCFKQNNSRGFNNKIFEFSTVVMNDDHDQHNSRLSFLKNSFQTLSNQKDQKKRQNSYFDIIEFCIDCDNFEYLNLAINEFKNKEIQQNEVYCGGGGVDVGNFNFFSTNIICKFKSIEMFDQIYNLFPLVEIKELKNKNGHHLFSDAIIYFIKFNQKFAIHIKCKYPTEYYNFTINYSQLLLTNQKYDIDCYQFIIDNWCDFCQNSIENIKLFSLNILTFTEPKFKLHNIEWILNNQVLMEYLLKSQWYLIKASVSTTKSGYQIFQKFQNSIENPTNFKVWSFIFNEFRIYPNNDSLINFTFNSDIKMSSLKTHYPLLYKSILSIN
ncbi:hypothetical protein DDB_G0295705 [Dictyostelium discoideum AX4]|uniref:Uncharacterized protein n=1 Tax=Dictyostelium discoideum TaxID=44689 RepID=B0G187_DICDI|nr:hypothetical protein DDB_G0295705 [Dictyostelium discoideum AX4]EDR41023.1 hypothetical protein DDB_G0295705 [Dictyostelium discoideum AX4]|eukprot:XP_001733050.1 hypothetical protein DDB_G0295705 [Dictyostelium discoideum AX4]